MHIPEGSTFLALQMPSLPTRCALWLGFWPVSRLLPFPPLSVIYQIFKGITKTEWRQKQPQKLFEDLRKSFMVTNLKSSAWATCQRAGR